LKNRTKRSKDRQNTENERRKYGGVRNEERERGKESDEE
jgi:hypothetical protein